MARWEMGDAHMSSTREGEPHAEDFFELGMIYSAGLDVETDLVAAHKWFNLASINGNTEAAHYRQEVAREMSAADVAAAQRAAREYLTKH